MCQTPCMQMILQCGALKNTASQLSIASRTLSTRCAAGLRAWFSYKERRRSAHSSHFTAKENSNILKQVFTWAVTPVVRYASKTRNLHLHLGFVHPLQDVALHQCLPLSSVCCLPNPGGSLLLCYVISPSSAWSSSRPLPSPWLPLCAALCPPIVL